MKEGQYFTLICIICSVSRASQYTLSKYLLKNGWRKHAPSEYAPCFVSSLFSATDFPVSPGLAEGFSSSYHTPDISNHFINANVCGEDTANYWPRTDSFLPHMMNFPSHFSYQLLCSTLTQVLKSQFHDSKTSCQLSRTHAVIICLHLNLHLLSSTVFTLYYSLMSSDLPSYLP